MRLVLSAMVICSLVSTSSQAQQRSNRFAEPATIDSTTTRLGHDRVRSSISDSGGQPSHAVRNGAIAGTVIGLAAGFYAGSRAGEMVGCKTYAVPNGPTPCDEQGTKNMLLIIGTAGGGLAFGLLGAGLGKVWNWMN